MYIFKLTNLDTNEVFPLVFPSTSDELMTQYYTPVVQHEGTYGLDYTEYLEALNKAFDTEQYTVWRHDNLGAQSSSTWDMSTNEIVSKFGYNWLIAFNRLPMFGFTLIKGGERWQTENGKILEWKTGTAGAVCKVTFEDSTTHTYGSESSTLDATWIKYHNPSNSFAIQYINDIERFLRTNQENNERNEKQGWGYVGYRRHGEALENVIDNYEVYGYLELDTSEYGGIANKESIMWWRVLRDEPYKTTDEDLNVDPYDKAPISNGGVGGNGKWYDRDDIVSIPSLPSINASATGMVTIFNPTLAQLQLLAGYLWSSNIEDILSKMWADPMDVMMGLSIVGCPVTSSNTKEVSVAGRSTGVNMNVASAQYIEVDCGSITLDEYYGSYMDYSPYTKISIYLPFIGEKELDVDVIQGHTVHVVYHCDILTGACVAFITVDNSVKYSFNGNMSSLIPFTSANFSRMISSAFGLVDDVMNMTAGNMLGGASGALNDVESMKPTIHRSGNIGSTTGLLSVRTPYLIIERPNLCIPQNQNQYTGYPSYTTVTVGNLSGYTEFDSIIADTLTCTKEEQDAIIARLKEGVII